MNWDSSSAPRLTSPVSTGLLLLSQDFNLGKPGKPNTLRRLLWIAPALLAGVGAWGSRALLRRRTPDPQDTPAGYGLAYTDALFPSRDGIALRGWWIQPPRGADNGRTLLIVHGHAGSMDGDTKQAAALAQAGFRVLLFNLRAHGSSGGDQVTFGAREYLDVLGALDWLESTQGVARVGVVGFSMGAGVALIAAHQDERERVAAIVADGTICRLSDGLLGMGRMRGVPGWVVWPFAVAILIAASVRAGVWLPWADPIRWSAPWRWRGRTPPPVLFIHGELDPFTYPARSFRMAERLGGKLWVVPRAGHRDAYRRYPEAYYPRVVAFLKAHV